jgi:hypothetical protein
MTEIINDSNEEAVVAEEVTEAPVDAVAEEVAEAPVAEPVAEEKPKAKKAKAEKVVGAEEVVALFSESNYSWDIVGKLKTGYNFVTKSEADQWLSGTLKVRLATPEEIAAKAAN